MTCKEEIAMMDKILVADDDLNICELLRLYLEKEGFEVVMATMAKKPWPSSRAKSPLLSSWIS